MRNSVQDKVYLLLADYLFRIWNLNVDETCDVVHEQNFKFLVVLFDKELNRLSHIKTLKAKCLPSSNILKYPSHPKTGCNQKTLLQLYI